MQRKMLAELAKESENMVYKGRVARFGTRKQSKKGKYVIYVETVLVTSITNLDGRYVTDHLWVDKRILESKGRVDIGDYIQFEGDIMTYCKGYFGTKQKAVLDKRLSLDYKIDNIRNIKLYPHPRKSQKAVKGFQFRGAF